MEPLTGLLSQMANYATAVGTGLLLWFFWPATHTPLLRGMRYLLLGILVGSLSIWIWDTLWRLELIPLGVYSAWRRVIVRWCMASGVWAAAWCYVRESLRLRSEREDTSC
jgi:hypothetical protein